jgi:hypothetical protein
MKTNIFPVLRVSFTVIACCLCLFGCMPVAAQNTPPHAASTKTWEFGNLTWSDAIQVPGCNKNAFAESLTQAQCRSYTSGTSTWYYYNWPYVDANKSVMCPSPWRVPAPADFHILADHATDAALISAWGVGGLAHGSGIFNAGSTGYYWTAEQLGSNSAYYLDYSSGYLHISQYYKHYGRQVRCVK